MSFDRKRTFGVVVPLILLVSLSIYSARAGPVHRPRTVQILDNPEEYEGEDALGMSGKLLDWGSENGKIVLSLERFGRTFEVRGRENLIGETRELEGGDIIQLLGTPRLATEGYVEATEIRHRPREREERLFLLSYLGLALLLLVLLKDRKELLEVVPWPTG